VSAFTRVVAAATAAAPVERMITRTRAGRALAARFVAGDTLQDGIECAERLSRQRFLTSLDLLGEEVHDREGARRATDEYVEALKAIASRDLAANISIKLTQLGLAIEEEMAAAAVDRLARAAAEASTTVTIDMEGSAYTEATIRIYENAQRQHGNMGIALQAALHRTPDDLERLIPLGGHIRLVKGAYVEPPSVALQTDREIVAAYVRLLTILMAAPDVRPAIATHDPTLIQVTLDLARKRREPFEFQMLYGIRTDEQRRLSLMGHDMRVYIPFGSAWYPYLTRRLAERPANLMFFLRALVGRR
jgi:proline dehydrogenase